MDSGLKFLNLWTEPWPSSSDRKPESGLALKKNGNVLENAAFCLDEACGINGSHIRHNRVTQQARSRFDDRSWMLLIRILEEKNCHAVFDCGACTNID